MNTRELQTVRIRIFNPIDSQELNIPFFKSVKAGFPSPASDFLEQNIDLNKTLIKHPSATFFALVDGHSMKNIGIDNGDLLVVDRSLKFSDNSIVVCYVDGEFTVKRLKLGSDCHYLIAENEDFEPIKITKDNHIIVWGVVSSVVKFFTKCTL